MANNKQVGAGLQVAPNSSGILQQWGLPEQIWQEAAELDTVYVYQYSGQILTLEKDFDGKVRARYDAPFINLYRAGL